MHLWVDGGRYAISLEGSSVKENEKNHGGTIIMNGKGGDGQPYSEIRVQKTQTSDQMWLSSITAVNGSGRHHANPVPCG